MKPRGGSPPRPAAGCTGDATLPPLARAPGGSGTLPKLGHGPGLLRGASKDCGAAVAAAHKEAPPTLAGEASEGTLAALHRSPLSGSSKVPFPADRIFKNDFQWTLCSRDLPMDVRPIIEDNKMLQEELRRYKMRVGEQEGQLAAKERQLVALRDELARERQRLHDCAVSPEQLLQDRQYRVELEQKEVALQQAQRQVATFERAKAAAERRLGADLAAEKRQQSELRRQLQQAQADMAEKQKQARFNQLHINQLYRRLEPLEAAVAAAGAPAPPLPPPPRQERVQVMLCCVYEQPAPTAADIAEAAARLAAAEAAAAAAALQRVQEPAALAIQAAWRGFKARRRVAALHAAATLIQAAARGMLVRRAVAPLRQQRTTDVDEGSASPAQRLAQRRQAAEQQYRDRLSRQQQRRPSVAASTRTANTAVEAAARARSQLGTAGQGGSPLPGSPGSGASAGGSGGGPAGRRGNHGIIITLLPGRTSGTMSAGVGHGATSAAGPAGSARSSQSGGSPSNVGGSSGGPGGRGSQVRRASRASVVGVLPLEQLQAQQGRAQQQGGDATSPSSRATRGSTLGPHVVGGEGQPAKRPSIQLGFASSAPRRSMAGGPV